MSDKKLIATLPAHCAGLRLDKALAKLFADYSRSFLQHCLTKGLILVNGNIAQADDKVLGGEYISFEVPQAEAATPVGEKLPLNIVYEDDHLIIVNKQAGIVVHPAAGHRFGTLLNALLHHCPKLEVLPRCGIVHRLDKDTSGLLAVAKTRAAHFSLIKQLQNKEMGRHYIALARGQFISGGKIDASIGRHPVDRKRMAVVRSGGKAALTRYRIAHKYVSHTRLDITLETGRTHQIRVHLSHIHHPLFGDALYGGRYRSIKGWQQQHLNKLRTFNRQALHASLLTLKHPYNGELCHYRAKLPDDMEQLFALFDENEKPYQTDDYFTDGVLLPNWQVSKRVKAYISTRLGGHSLAPYDSMNLGLHVGDDTLRVMKNRSELQQRLKLPSEPAWLQQVHGNNVIVVEQNTLPCKADAAISFEAGRVCAVMVADCLPVLFCDKQATRVGTAHAGWRGLAAGILENTVAALDCDPVQIYAFLGPAISANAYRVSDTVRDALLMKNDQNALCFMPDNCGTWTADLYQLARLKLQRIGVQHISGGSHCTYYNRKHFFSHRRDVHSGRMAALIYFEST